MAALVPLFLAGVLPDHLRTLVCRFSGAAMDEASCCPLGPVQPADAQARLRDQPCCLIRAVELARVVSDRRAETAQPRHDDTWVPAPAMTAPVDRTHAALIRSSPPDPRGPPMVLLKRSFLI